MPPKVCDMAVVRKKNRKISIFKFLTAHFGCLVYKEIVIHTVMFSSFAI